MLENVEYVQRGFRILRSALATFIGRELRHKYGNNWWTKVEESLSEQLYNLPASGDFETLVDSLDIANCLNLLDRRWKDDFQWKLNRACRSWANELKNIRNLISHLGGQDLDQPMAERALNTMVFLCKEIDGAAADEINEIYLEVRNLANDSYFVPEEWKNPGLPQPDSESSRGALTEGSLLQLEGTEYVEKTTLTRKITYGGKTVIYPVYRVRLDKLFYNDQNDRIATWISRYAAENGENSLKDLDREVYNRVIESFIYESNEDAIQKTQKNIALVGQREPGVTLADGRVVDGNRRFTCLRRIQRERSEPLYFETVIMDVDIQADKKQIKLLELAIQHGEEKKVDYDLIDFAVGTYRDIVETRLLTVDEYASSTNEPVSEVRKRIEIAQIINEFLDYIRLHGQYFVAREYQVYSLFQEMMTPLRQVGEDERPTLKHIAFNNAMMKTFPDQRQFIRDIKKLVKVDTKDSFFKRQMEINQEIQERFQNAIIRSKEDVDRFASENQDLVSLLRISMEDALQQMRIIHLKGQPLDSTLKAIDLLLDIDSRQFNMMDPDEKEELLYRLEELQKMTTAFKNALEQSKENEY